MYSTRLALVALVTVASLAPASPLLAATADHQQCFKIKDGAAATPYVADLVPTDGAFPVATGCELKVRAKLLCIDVEKTNVTPAPPGADEGLPAQKSLCYKVKCPAPASPITVNESDQFGVHAIEVKKTFLLCAPIPAVAPEDCVVAGDCAPLANATVACAAGACVIGSCDGGFLDCDLDAGTGCEVDSQTDPNNCGGCSMPCSVPANATAGCTAGACTIGSCDAGFLDCDLDADTGCEVDAQTDPNNCGGCGLVCPGVGASCVAGVCF